MSELFELLGNLGEFVGAIAVVATLVYLGIQVRHGKEALDANTSALNESRKLALAQTYQSRAFAMMDLLRDMRESEHLALLQHGPGEHEGDSGDARIRYGTHMRWWANFLDNIHFQHQNGLIEDEYYVHTFEDVVRRTAPRWRSLGIREARPSFRDEVERILADAPEENASEAAARSSSEAPTPGAR